MFSKIKTFDWPLMIRLIVAGIFIWIAIAFRDWIPALFGFTISATAIYASFRKKGCGYEQCGVYDQKAHS